MKILTGKSVSLWAVAVVATCALFAIFAPEELSVLFWENLVWLLALETFGLFSIFAVSSRGAYSTQNVAVASQIVNFTGCGFLLFAAYNGLTLIPHCDVSPKWYYAAQIVLSAWWIGKILFLSMGAEAQTELHAAHERRVAEKRARTATFPALVPVFRTVVAGKSSLDALKKQSAERALTRFFDAATRVPAGEFSENPTFAELVPQEFAAVQRAMDALADAADADAPDALAALEKTARDAAARISAARTLKRAAVAIGDAR